MFDQFFLMEVEYNLFLRNSRYIPLLLLGLAQLLQVSITLETQLRSILMIILIKIFLGYY